MDKEERDSTLMMELKRILLEVNVSSEYIKSLFQEELNSESFIVEKQQYRRRKNLLICYRGIQFLLERKFEMFINITLFQTVIFPTMKEMIMEDYLSDISNDMIVCLIRAGTVVIRCEIWKYFLCVRDSLIKENPDNMLLEDKRKSGKAKSKKPKTDKITLCNKKSKVTINDRTINERIINIDDFKCSSNAEKLTAEIKSNEETEIGRHKLVTDKPWFSSSFSVANSSFANDNPLSDLSVSKEFNPDTVQSIPNTINTYDMYHKSGTNHQTQESTSTNQSRESRFRPRIVVDKISKLFVFKK